MPAGMFSIDSILSARPSCKEPLLLHRSGPVVLPAGLTDSLYADNSGLYSSTCGPSAAGVQPLGGTAIEYNGYYYGQLHVQRAVGGAVPHGPTRDCSSAPAGYDGPGSVLISPVPHQMVSYMNMGGLSHTELQLLNQLHCRRKRRHRTIFTDEQLEALEGLFQETKYLDVGTQEQLARKVHLREEKVQEEKECVAQLYVGMKAGWLRPVVGSKYPLKMATKAHEDIIKCPGAAGKMVLCDDQLSHSSPSMHLSVFVAADRSNCGDLWFWMSWLGNMYVPPFSHPVLVFFSALCSFFC
ncbi:homeobox protein goosecoid-like [Thalassophryne amazonica]|uniref:homeobox protein goosecoid-like n=1 Tax=Thalassophryne amazonica TaxID=390379 RepID=UPI0014725B31|nr:homeobox protein goosecoid-like [Thalassophryne amazonica]